MIEKIFYIRNKKNQPVGCLMAVREKKDEGNVFIGWSYLKKPDVFSKDKAKMIARGRASKKRLQCEDGTFEPSCVHPLIEKNLEEFMRRCVKFFKVETVNCKFPTIVF